MNFRNGNGDYVVQAALSTQVTLMGPGSGLLGTATLSIEEVNIGAGISGPDPLTNNTGNFRVRDLDAMVAQLRASGVEVRVHEEEYSFGRFADLADPEGNPIQLWQPADPNA